MKSISNLELVEFLCVCDSDALFIVLSSVHSDFSLDSRINLQSYLDKDIPLPVASSYERQRLATFVVEQLSYFGSHSIAYGWRKISPFHEEPGVSYRELLSDVEQILFEQFSPKSLPARLNSVAGRERQIAHLLLQRSLQDMPEEEVIGMLKECGLEADTIKQALGELVKPALAQGQFLY